MVRKFWTCPKGCGARWERSLVKCRTEGCTGRRPKKRVARHARTLSDDSYAVYERVAREAHGVTDESCCACEKPRKQERHHDRDHDHVTGLPRGLACAGNTGCNALMPRQLTLERARAVVSYLERVDSYYAALEALSGAYVASEGAL